MPLTAITREVSSSINDCELSFHERQPIDVAKAMLSTKRIRIVSPNWVRGLFLFLLSQDFRMPSLSRIRRWL